MTALLLLPAWLAAGIDLRTRRIPNWVTGAGLLLALVVAAVGGTLASAAVGAGVCLAIGLVLASFARGAFGGGDVKLMAYGGAVTGIAGVPAFLFWMSLAGGLLALGALALLRRRHLTIPYGPAIAVGVSAALLLA